MWALINVNQLIAFMPLMNVRFPPNTILLFKLLAFLNSDIYLLQRAYDLTFGEVLSFPQDSHPYNDRF